MAAMGLGQLASNEADFVNSDCEDPDGAPLLDQASPKPVAISASSSTSSVDQDAIRAMLAEVSE
jgi:hypothetical protein